jgi:hypothetical protein
LPISLSAGDQAAIEHAARPLDPRQRDAFVAACMSALEGAPELGPGVVHRVIRATQRQFWDPPMTCKGVVGHSVSRSKLRSGPALV